MNLIQEARKVIKSALIKIAMPQVFKATTPADYRIVFRVQNSHNEGPHNEFVWPSKQDYNLFETSIHARQKPNLRQDLGFDEEERNFSAEDIVPYLFGFLTHQQYESWYSPCERQLLKANGFDLVERKAKEIKDSKQQIMFLPYEEK